MGFELVDLLFRRDGHGEHGKAVLSGASARFPEGSVSVVTGENGSGKTTLLHLLGGLLRPTGGEIRAGGEAVSRWTTPHLDRWRRQVGIVFQDLRLLGDLTVLENVMLPAIPRGRDIPAMRADGIAALKRLGVAHLAPRKAGALSGGEGQRVALARALAHSPRYLVADEVFSHQDGPGRELTAAALLAQAARGAAVVVSSHGESLEAAHRVFELRDGRLERRR